MSEEPVILSIAELMEIGIRTAPKRKEDTWKSIVEYTLDGQYIRTFRNMEEVHKFHNISRSTIWSCCTAKTIYCTLTKSIFLYRGEDIAKRVKEYNEQQARKESRYPNIEKSKSNKVVCEYSLGGKLLRKWDMIKQAAEYHNVSTNKITNCCNGRRAFLNERIFLFEGDDSLRPRVNWVKSELYKLSNKRPLYREVDEYTLDGKFVKGYPSASAAGRELGIHVSNITRCCRGGDKHLKNMLTTGGRIFLWVGSSISERLEKIKEYKNKKQ